MDSHVEAQTSIIHFTPSPETRALIEEASEHTDIDSFINSCIALFGETSKEQ